MPVPPSTAKALAEGANSNRIQAREGDAAGASRTWIIMDVVMGSNSGCPNSRCIPRPMKPDLIIEPPQVDPWMMTGVGSGQNTGCPEIKALPKP